MIHKILKKKIQENFNDDDKVRIMKRTGKNGTKKRRERKENKK